MTKKILKTKTTLFPLPTVLVTCQNHSGKNNIITISYTGVVNADPPMIYISVRPSRFSYPMIKESGEFVVNIPSESLFEITDYCGVASGRKVDKFMTTHLTPVASSKVKPPLIKECPVNLECMVKQVVPLGTHDIFIAEVVAVQADESVLSSNEKVDISKARPFTFCYDSMKYWNLKKEIGGYGFTKGKLK